jgi:hypothetical protein
MLAKVVVIYSALFACMRRLHQYAREAAWKEDHRRLTNGETASRALGLALAHPVSVTWSGRWQKVK